MQKRKIYFYIGTTAELIKLSPIIRELKKRKISFKIITSGQNEIHFNELEYFIGSVKPHITTGEKIKKSSLFYFGIWAIRSLYKSIVLLRHEFESSENRNSYLIIHGDTISSVIGAIVAKYYHLKVVHVESGLRSFNFFEPFPEEISRYIVSYLTDIHFCPNQWSVDNLKKHNGIKVNTFQNTLIETCLYTVNHSKTSTYSKMLTKKKYFLLVIHRQEKMFSKSSTRELIQGILSSMVKDITCVFIMHHLTKKLINEELTSEIERDNNVVFIPRLPYREFAPIINNSQFIVTDGGSNQEEAYYLGKPCLVLRNRTERIEGLDENVIISRLDRKVIKDFFNNYMINKRRQIALKKRPSQIIVDYLMQN
jgi:UDP-N-acetylglucosamine 2-epimerase (non-hydrolysing)